MGSLGKRAWLLALVVVGLGLPLNLSVRADIGNDPGKAAIQAAEAKVKALQSKLGKDHLDVASGMSDLATRHAAASFWSIRDPANVRGVKDLLGHYSLGTMDKHYIIAQSRVAGRVLACAVDAARK